MKTKKSLLVLIAIILVFTLVFTACGGGGGGNVKGGKDGNEEEEDEPSGTDTALNGTWILDDDVYGYYEYELKLNNGNYESSWYGDPDEKGTYTTSGSNITITTTHLFGIGGLGMPPPPDPGEPVYLDHDGKRYPVNLDLYMKLGGISPEKWCTKNEIKEFFKTHSSFWLGTDAELDEWLSGYDDTFEPDTYSYSVNGNKLTLKGKEYAYHAGTYTKK